MKSGTRRPMAIVLTAAVSILASALSHAQARPASSAQVAPGVIRPGPTADEAGLTQRPIGIDAEFVDKAGMIGKVERQAGQLALDRSSNADVKAFARKMVDDHARIADELRHIGAQKGVPVQTRMLVDPEVTALRAKDGRAFDAAYVALAGPRAHEAAVRLYETEAKEGRDPQLRAFAARTLPMLNAHLSAARQLAKTVAAAQ
jgi:putative membrane protein